MKWYKRDPEAFAGGTAELSLEEVGAYTRIIDLIYSRDGHVLDDERFIARALRCDIRVWRRIRQRLIETGKISTSGGLIANLRATSEISYAQVRMKKDQKRNKNNPTNLILDPILTTTTTEKEKASPSLSHPAHARERAKTPLPENWHPELVGTEQFDGFCDHARSHDRHCADWEAARRTWNRKQGGSNGNGRPPAPKDDPRSIRGAFDRLSERFGPGWEDEARELSRQANLRLLPGGSSKRS